MPGGASLLTYGDSTNDESGGGLVGRAILAAACFRAWKAALVMAAACVSAAIRPRVGALPMGNREFMSRN